MGRGGIGESGRKHCALLARDWSSPSICEFVGVCLPLYLEEECRGRVSGEDPHGTRFEKGASGTIRNDELGDPLFSVSEPFEQSLGRDGIDSSSLKETVREERDLEDEQREVERGVTDPERPSFRVSTASISRIETNSY